MRSTSHCLELFTGQLPEQVLGKFKAFANLFGAFLHFLAYCSKRVGTSDYLVSVIFLHCNISRIRLQEKNTVIREKYRRTHRFVVTIPTSRGIPYLWLEDRFASRAAQQCAQQYLLAAGFLVSGTAHAEPRMRNRACASRTVTEQLPKRSGTQERVTEPGTFKGLRLA